MPPQSSTSRRKPKDDDAAYIGASGSKRPRDSADKTAVPDGRRAKRKKVQSVYDPTVSPSSTRRTQELAALPPSLIDFATLPREVVHQYLVQFDITPILHPSPISVLSPPPPEALLDPQHGQPMKFPSPTATGTTPANHSTQRHHHHQLINPNRPTPQQQDHSIFSAKHYRSVDDDEDSTGPSSHRTATLADIADLDIVLARLAERHFRDESVHELDTLATFLALVKNSANGKYPFMIISSLMS
ncbi:hypothetical protein BDM02DRAFT_3127045 [Thelephora ganbajun]|uniref:Uncharacterized protein n=1 Tax=Thelephora ganbajun TaxID=370292 RepID=A0ACB6ZN98_THEGA|nr:hypothetical protein BDM02DRAFT_3127045 [Thelephora ganbajun]